MSSHCIWLRSERSIRFVLRAVAEFEEEQQDEQYVGLRGGERIAAVGGEESGGQQGDDAGENDAIVDGESELVGEEHELRERRG